MVDILKAFEVVIPSQVSSFKICENLNPKDQSFFITIELATLPFDRNSFSF